VQVYVAIGIGIGIGIGVLTKFKTARHQFPFRVSPLLFICSTVIF